MTTHDHPDGVTPDTGNELSAGRGDADRHRTRVQEAFEALLQIRRLMHTTLEDPLSVPADWERTRAVRAIALALQAAGIEPSAVDAQGTRVATGYSVTETEQPHIVRVQWLGPRGSGATQQAPMALRRCEDVLGGLGWTVLEYKTARGGRHLDVEPPFPEPAGRGTAHRREPKLPPPDTDPGPGLPA